MPEVWQAREGGDALALMIEIGDLLDLEVRKVWVARYALDQTVSQVSDSLRISEGTVKRRLSLARRFARSYLENGIP